MGVHLVDRLLHLGAHLVLGERRQVRAVEPVLLRRAPGASSGSSVISATRYGRRSPITTACEIQRFCLSPFSRLAGVMFLPPAVMMMSFLRPVM